MTPALTDLLAIPLTTLLVALGSAVRAGSLLRFAGRIHVLVYGGGLIFSDFWLEARIVVSALRAMGANQLDLAVATQADLESRRAWLACLLRCLRSSCTPWNGRTEGAPRGVVAYRWR